MAISLRSKRELELSPLLPRSFYYVGTRSLLTYLPSFPPSSPSIENQNTQGHIATRSILRAAFQRSLHYSLIIIFFN